MPLEIKIPSLGESVTEVEIASWLIQEGDPVDKNENLVVIESDKATVELPAPTSGRLTKILKNKGDRLPIGEVIALLEPSPNQPHSPPATPSPQTRITPAARRLLAESGLRPEDIPASGPGGRLLKEDVLGALKAKPAPPPAERQVPAPAATPSTPSAQGDRQEEAVPMSMLRRTIAQRLVQAQQKAALLTTFNEIDMSAVLDLRKQYQEAFQTRFNVKLGFMSFFVKATIDALKKIPQLNAEIRDHDIIYRNYYDIGVAIGAERGLVVPVLRHAERLSFAEIEQTIHELATRAQQNRLKPDELRGGTFTISNGGVYGSLLSTPIVNPPQSGVLGLHAIQDRPVAQNKNVLVRPMMYVALTYDHRIVDGREAVTFLKRIKETIEDPTRLLIEI